jgi:ABC-type multidrug transport system permease subunit
MAIVFSAVILYRRLILAQHGIILDDYFIGVIKAFIIAKVVMIGAFLGISRKFEHQPLIIPVLYKSILFTLMVMLFDIIEELIKGFIYNQDIFKSFEELQNHANAVWLGASLLIFFIFIPFFAVKELVRVMGNEKVQKLFFNKRTEYH